MYILISLLITIILLLFLIIKKFERINKKYEKPISFLLTIVATFIGVFVAIDFNNYNEHKNDIAKTINLLNVSGYELGQVKMECNMMQSVIYSDSTLNVNSYIHSNPIARPEIFESLIDNELFVRNISLESFEALSRVNKNIQKIYYWLQSNEYADNKKELLGTLSNAISYTHKIIATEIDYLDRKINKEDLKRLDEEYIYELLNITNAKLLNDFNKNKIP